MSDGAEIKTTWVDPEATLTKTKEEKIIAVMTNAIAWTCETWDLTDKPFQIMTTDAKTAMYRAAATKALDGFDAVEDGRI